MQEARQPLFAPAALSARHVHLSQEHVEALFGRGHRLTPLSDLSQPGQFAAKECVEVMGPKRSIPGVRVLGPARGETQVELSVTDGYILGINLPVRLSGDVAGTPGAHLIGPHGAVGLREGCIVAVRHLHLSTADAKRAGIAQGQKVFVRLPGPRGLILDEVVARVSDGFSTELHVDTDEGNAAGLRQGELVEVAASLCEELCGRAGSCPIAPSQAGGTARPFCDFTTKGVSIR